MPDQAPVRRAVERIVAWTKANEWADAIEPERLARDAKDVSLAELFAALLFLQRAGAVSVRYRPVSPFTKQVVRRDFESPVELRKAHNLHDASENSFDGWDADIVQVFVPSEAGE